MVRMPVRQQHGVDGVRRHAEAGQAFPGMAGDRAEVRAAAEIDQDPAVRPLQQEAGNGDPGRHHAEALAQHRLALVRGDADEKLGACVELAVIQGGDGDVAELEGVGTRGSHGSWRCPPLWRGYGCHRGDAHGKPRHSCEKRCHALRVRPRPASPMPPSFVPGPALISSMTGFARVEGGDRPEAAELGVGAAQRQRPRAGAALSAAAGFDALEPALREAAGKQLKRGNVTANLTVRRDEAAKLAADPGGAGAGAGAGDSTSPRASRRRAAARRGAAGAARRAARRPPPAETEERPQPGGGRPRRLRRRRCAAWSRRARARARGSPPSLAGLLDEIAALRARAARGGGSAGGAARAHAGERAGAAARGAGAAGGADRAGSRAARRALGRARGTGPARQPYRRRPARCWPRAATVGRRFDFLVQEFNREANTLCSKSASVRADHHRAEAEGGDRAAARAGAEHRMSRRCASAPRPVPGDRAPSGAGKSSITRALLATEPELTLSVSVTTRRAAARRAGRRALPFPSRSREFDAMVARGELLEWARGVRPRLRHARARRWKQALAAGRDVVFDIDWQGHRQLRAALPGRRGRPVHPAAVAGRAGGAAARGAASDGDAEIARRMAAARDEIAPCRRVRPRGGERLLRGHGGGGKAPAGTGPAGPRLSRILRRPARLRR